MNETADEREDLTSAYLRAHEGIAHSAFSPPAARVFEVLLKISFLLGRVEACVPVLQDLLGAADVHKGNLSRHLRELITSEAVTMREENGCFYFEPKPDWTVWRCRRRYTYAEEAVMEQALQRLLEIGRSDPGQLEIPGLERPADFDAEISRQFAVAAVVPGTTETPLSNKGVVPGTTLKVVNSRTGERGTTEKTVVPCTTGPPYEGVVPGTTALKALKAIELKGFKAPKALGAETAALIEQAEGTAATTPRGNDPDFDVLIERMWRVIPDQRESYAGAWINRATCNPQAMRMAVDRFLESPPKHLRTTHWQWLRAEYIASAHKLGLEDKLSGQDQVRRGWWSRLAERAKIQLWLAV